MRGDPHSIYKLDKTPTLGSIESTDDQKHTLAVRSMENNVKDPIFRKLFPSLVKNYKQNSIVQSQVSQLSVVEEGDDDSTENEVQGATVPTNKPTNNIQNNVNNVIPRGTIWKTAGVVVVAILFVSIWSRVYM